MSILNASKNQSFTAYSEAMVFSLVNTEAHTKDGKKKKKILDKWHAFKQGKLWQTCTQTLGFDIQQ